MASPAQKHSPSTASETESLWFTNVVALELLTTSAPSPVEDQTYQAICSGLKSMPTSERVRTAQHVDEDGAMIEAWRRDFIEVPAVFWNRPKQEQWAFETLVGWPEAGVSLTHIQRRMSRRVNQYAAGLGWLTKFIRLGLAIYEAERVYPTPKAMALAEKYCCKLTEPVQLKG